jgi:hypothetical protein
MEHPRGSLSSFLKFLAVTATVVATVPLDETGAGEAIDSGVAADVGSVAEDAGGSALRHYTTSDAAASISKSGEISPSPTSGTIWTTPDVYGSGADAQSSLALPNTPDGYFEFPRSSLVDPSPPGLVEPDNGFPGGGTEITTHYPIDVSGLPFIPFG